eukprot:gene14751-biopygen14211
MRRNDKTAPKAPENGKPSCHGKLYLLLRPLARPGIPYCNWAPCRRILVGIGYRTLIFWLGLDVNPCRPGVKPCKPGVSPCKPGAPQKGLVGLRAPRCSRPVLVELTRGGHRRWAMSGDVMERRWAGRAQGGAGAFPTFSRAEQEFHGICVFRAAMRTAARARCGRANDT